MESIYFKYNISKEDCKFSLKELWKKGKINYFAYLSSKYQRSDFAAYDEIKKRFIRKKGIVFPDEIVEFDRLFDIKHPEMRYYRNRDNQYFRYGGAYYDTRLKWCRRLFSNEGLFTYDIDFLHLERKRNLTQIGKSKILLECMNYEIYSMKRGFINAINKRN